jgi:hypothetical protein
MSIFNTQSRDILTILLNLKIMENFGILDKSIWEVFMF